jgi:hypothetical protein
VFDGLGGDGGGTFFTELEPVLEVLLLLGNDGCGHLAIPRHGGILVCYVLSTLNKLAQIIKISLIYCEWNGLPSHVCRIAVDECQTNQLINSPGFSDLAEQVDQLVTVQSGDLCNPVDVSDQVCSCPDEEHMRCLIRWSGENATV